MKSDCLTSIQGVENAGFHSKWMMKFYHLVMSGEENIIIKTALGNIDMVKSQHNLNLPCENCGKPKRLHTNLEGANCKYALEMKA